jgi:hypothetical protein
MKHEGIWKMALDFTDGVVSQRTETRYTDLCQALGAGQVNEAYFAEPDGTPDYEMGW